MRALSRSELAMLLTWAFNEQKVETASNPHADALTLYYNVMALPVAEAATIVSHARAGGPPEDPVKLAIWTRGLSMLCEMLQQPLCELQMFTRNTKAETAPTASAA
ncbi:hypothetical protein [Pelagibacterium xiamenense]|uniref:hypothetical protein n=1 Tax=Pelagibacterium xiamenense TaxID=2901140 RepID=UPI001E331660|nr:hypothetical protein [Pelagibacterium xiamenense]MCD7059939.1 hypothetical protein [Pelagibacterium xiamenense]